MINGLPTTCDRVSFTEDSRTMVVHCAESVHVLQVDPFAGATVVQSINIEKRKYLICRNVNNIFYLHLLIISWLVIGFDYIPV